MSETYRVVIKGVRDGFAKEQVVSQLAALFKVTEDQTRTILDSSSFVVKKGIDLQSTEKYRATLEQCGCVCAIEAETNQMLQQNTPQPSKETIGFCSQCGTQLVMSARFCSKCGMAIDVTPIPQPSHPLEPSTDLTASSRVIESAVVAPTPEITANMSPQDVVNERSDGNNLGGTFGALFFIVCVGAAVYFGYPMYFGHGVDYYTCENNLKISACRYASPRYECSFTNTFDGAMNLRSFGVWMYDKQGTQIGPPNWLESAVIQPGSTIKDRFFIDDSASKVIFCSEDPTAPFLKDFIKKIEN